MNTSLLKQIKLLNTDNLWIVYHYQPMNQKLISELNGYKNFCKKRMKRMDFDKPKGILIGYEKDGSRKFIEVSL